MARIISASGCTMSEGFQGGAMHLFTAASLSHQWDISVGDINNPIRLSCFLLTHWLFKVYNFSDNRLTTGEKMGDFTPHPPNTPDTHTRRLSVGFTLPPAQSAIPPPRSPPPPSFMAEVNRVSPRVIHHTSLTRLTPDALRHSTQGGARQARSQLVRRPRSLL